MMSKMPELKETELPCPSCGSGKLSEPATEISGLGFVPVKCVACGFTGRRVNLIVVPDRKAGESWAGVSG
jgi:predicted Zn-ribbon and HTH transcriptional regulator